MSQQRHLIKRQILELTVGRTQPVPQLQAELSRIYRRRIVPLIDRYCTELSAPDQIHRVSLLEIDLGRVDSEHLEDEIMAQLSPQLRRLLAAHIRAPGQALPDSIRGEKIGTITDTKTSWQLELLSFFAQTGSLPWWADTNHAQVLDDCVVYLVQYAPQAVRRLMSELARDKRAIERLVHHFPDDILVSLCEILAPPHSAILSTFAQDVTATLQRERAAASGSPAQRRIRVWTDVVTKLSLGQPLDTSEARTAPDPLSPIVQETKSEPVVDLDFNDGDEVYIENAGLVIVWPFIENFLARLGLVEDKQFVSSSAKHRAIGILHYLVTDEPSPPEYAVALNKVLCGLELSEVFDFGMPVTEAEAEECHNLLSAVIAQVPILNNMSHTGFQDTFLLRKGRLGTDDGTWLLHVERETYNVILDRFPWTLERLKLPWMESMLRVEWG